MLEPTANHKTHFKRVHFVSNRKSFHLMVYIIRYRSIVTHMVDFIGIGRHAAAMQQWITHQCVTVCHSGSGASFKYTLFI